MEEKALDLTSLKLKLKISTPTKQLHTSKTSTSNAIKHGGKHGGKHICPFCRKGFDSGKAIGGHIRIHTRKIRKCKPIGKDSMFGNEVTDLSLRDKDGKINCCICGKDFRSLKSLFGHMRNHPDRGWRGIRPPPISEKESSDNDEDMDAERCEDDEATAIDGSNLLKISKRYEKFMSDDVIAACTLVILSRDNFEFSASLQKKKRSEDIEIGERKRKPRSENESDPDFYRKRMVLKSPENEIDYEEFTDRKLNFDELEESESPTMVAKRLYFKMQAVEGNPKKLDFDINEPYTFPDGEDAEIT